MLRAEEVESLAKYSSYLRLNCLRIARLGSFREMAFFLNRRLFQSTSDHFQGLRTHVLSAIPSTWGS